MRKQDKPEIHIPVTFHPGEFLREEMNARGWSIETLAERSLIGREILEGVLAEKRPVTLLVAHGLAEAFGTSRELWTNLQGLFNESQKVNR